LPYNDAAASDWLDVTAAGIVETTSPVVVASKSSEGITQSNHLAVVPFGDGQTTIRLDRGKQAEVVTHHFGGSSTREAMTIRDGRLALTIQEHGASGLPVEWLEVFVTL
jgi:hypothetical protein